MDSEIITLFERMCRQNGMVRLLNIYKGLPISYEASVAAVNGPVVTIHCNKYQIACLLLEKGTYIQNDEIAGTIRGQLYAIHLEREEVELTNLTYVNGRIGLRTQVRVEPEAPTWVLLKSAISPVMAVLCDISPSGIGIYLEKFYYRSSLYRPGSPVGITLELPWVGDDAAPAVRTTGTLRQTGVDPSSRFSRGALRGIQSMGGETERDSRKERPVEVHDGVVRINAHGVVKSALPELAYNRYRIGMQLDLDASGKQAFTQFIAQRQSEIIKEFRLIYASLVGHHNT